MGKFGQRPFMLWKIMEYISVSKLQNNSKNYHFDMIRIRKLWWKEIYQKRKLHAKSYLYKSIFSNVYHPNDLNYDKINQDTII